MEEEKKIQLVNPKTGMAYLIEKETYDKKLKNDKEELIEFLEYITPELLPNIYIMKNGLIFDMYLNYIGKINIKEVENNYRLNNKILDFFKKDK